MTRGMSVVDGIARVLATIAADPPTRPRELRAMARLFDRMPVDAVDARAIDAALAALCPPSAYAFAIGRKPPLASAIARLIEAREATEEEAAFVGGVLRADTRPRASLHQRLQRALRLADTMPEVSGRAATVRRLARDAAIVEGARTAVAVGRALGSAFVPVLFADGSPGSVDVVLPLVDAACRAGARELDYVRRRLAPLLPATAAADALRAMLGEAQGSRRARSPARAFALAIGIAAPPARIRIGVTFFDARGAQAYILNLDSDAHPWCRGRRDAKWGWRAIDPLALGAELPVEVDSYALRLGAGVARGPVETWIVRVMGQAAARRVTRRTASRRR